MVRRATEDLEVTVTDEDEPGKVTLTKPQPQVGRDLTASLSDVDAPVQDEEVAVGEGRERGRALDGHRQGDFGVPQSCGG